MERCHPHSHGPIGGNYSQVGFSTSCACVYSCTVTSAFRLLCAVLDPSTGTRPRVLCTLGNIPGLVFKVYSCIYLCVYAVYAFKNQRYTNIWLKLHTYQLTVCPLTRVCLCFCVSACVCVCVCIVYMLECDWTKDITCCRQLSYIVQPFLSRLGLMVSLS